MKAILIILGIIGILILLKSCIPKNENTFNDNSRPKLLAEKSEIINDRIVIINGANYNDIKKALNQFCNTYNKENYQAIIRLTAISQNDFVLTFPYGIDFTTFCFLINYLYYPNEIFYKADIKGWTTTKSNDEFISPENSHKYVMLYIPSDDKEYDNIYLTTEDNKGYKLGFAVGGLETLNIPKENFEKNKYNIADVKNKSSEEIQ